MDIKPDLSQETDNNINASSQVNDATIVNPAQDEESLGRRKYKNKLIFWCLVFPWVLIFGSMFISIILNFVIVQIGLPNATKLLSNLMTLLLGLAGFLGIPIGLIYFIVKISKK